jgi:hypothetical protein
MTSNDKRKYEFPLLVAIVGVLAYVLLGEFGTLRDDIEEAAVQSEVAAIRVELLDWLAHREAVGGKLPESGNPLRWIGRQPAAYLGELDAAPQENAVWYFDRRREELVYRFRSSREARFRLVRGTGAADVSGGFAGVALRRVDLAQTVN